MIIMNKYLKRELPIRAKIIMIEDIIKILSCLHTGDRPAADVLIDHLKARAVFLDLEIQQDVLRFSEQICFQYDYDPWHKITPEVIRAADRLIETLGFYRDRFPFPKPF